MFSKELELSISQAYQEARERRHEFLTVEHMLLALLDNASALSILSACEVDVANLEKEIRKVLKDTVPLLSDEDNQDTQPTIGFQRVLQRALYHVQSAGKEEVLGANAAFVIWFFAICDFKSCQKACARMLLSSMEEFDFSGTNR